MVSPCDSKNQFWWYREFQSYLHYRLLQFSFSVSADLKEDLYKSLRVSTRLRIRWWARESRIDYVRRYLSFALIKRLWINWILQILLIDLKSVQLISLTDSALVHFFWRAGCQVYQLKQALILFAHIQWIWTLPRHYLKHTLFT